MALTPLPLLAGCQSDSPGSAGALQAIYHPIPPQCVQVAAGVNPDMTNFLQNESGFFGMETNTFSASLGVAGSNTGGTYSSARIDNDFAVYRTCALPVTVVRLGDAASGSLAVAGSQTGGTANCGCVYSKNPEYEVEPNEDYVAQSGETVTYRGAIPVYIGIGVRIEADVTNFGASLNFSSLPAIAAQVSGGHAQGTISVYSMGISGSSIGLMIQQPITLNDTSVATALQSVGAIKASLAAADTNNSSQNTNSYQLHLNPQVIGFDCLATDPKELQAIQDHIQSTTYTIHTTTVNTGGGTGAATQVADGVTFTQPTTPTIGYNILQVAQFIKSDIPQASTKQVNAATSDITTKVTTKPPDAPPNGVETPAPK